MKIRFLLCSGMLFLLPEVKAQLSAGYGLAYFPSGMNHFYLSAHQFHNQSHYDYYGPLTRRGLLLPFFHGIAINWTAGKNADAPVRMNFNWNNVHNRIISERTDSIGNVTRLKSRIRVNTLLFGMAVKFKKESGSKLETWHLNGVFTQYSAFGPPRNSTSSWSRTLRKFDFGLDAGITCRAPGGTLYLHIQQTFFLTSQYNPSYLGLQYRIRLTRNKY